MWLVVILAIVVFLVMEHAVAFWCLFVPLMLIIITLIIQFLMGNGRHISRLFLMSMAFLLAIVLLLIVCIPDKCEHEVMGKSFSFQPQNSTATSYLRQFCANCDDDFGYKIFRGTPTDTSYLDVVAAHSNSDKIVQGKYYTMSAKVAQRDFDFNKTEIACKVQNGEIIVFFFAEFREEYEESVALLQEGDIVTFRGRFYDKGCGFTDCQLIMK